MEYSRFFGSIPDNIYRNISNKDKQQETVDLVSLGLLFSDDLSDSEFHYALFCNLSLLPNVFREMRGLQQAEVHQPYDPTQHTLRGLLCLNTTGLSLEDKIITRTAHLFHDVGKVYDPLSTDHAFISKLYITQHEYLQKMNINSDLVSRIYRHVRFHDVLGEITRMNAEPKKGKDILVAYFPSHHDQEIHYRIVLADVSSIPGLHDQTDEITKKYRSIKSVK